MNGSFGSVKYSILLIILMSFTVTSYLLLLIMNSNLYFIKNDGYIIAGVVLNKSLVKTGLGLSFIIIYIYVLPFRLTEGQGQNPINLILSQFFLFLFCCSCWLSIIYILHRPSPQSRWRKALICFISCAVLSNAFYFVTHPFVEDYPMKPLSNFPLYWVLFRLSNRGFFICLLMYSTAYYYINQKEIFEVKIKMENIKNENLLVELNFLKQQINSHFIFNSLNILRSGYTDNWSKKYLIELSKIFQHQLYANSRSPTTGLNDEIKLVQSYIHVLQERFEDALQVKIQISSHAEKLNVPPYTVQTLVENSIKHNSMAPDQPLLIEIFDEQDFICVKNNFQPKKTSNIPKQNSGIGLKSLDSRYQLIANKSIFILQDTSNFIVKSPLLA